MPQKIAIYIRVSTQEQAQEGYSVEQQTDRLTSYCKAMDWPIANVYIDPGFSGANLERPVLQKLFYDINDKKIDCVLVYKLDRLSRSQKDTLYMIEDVFLAHGVDFVSMQENFDTSTPFGRAMIGILSVFAQLEREQIKERMSMGRMGRAKAGLYHGGGNIPFGYDYINGHLVINETEAIIIRDIYKLFLAGTAINRIETIIQEKYGREIYHTMIHNILSRHIYLGEIIWNGVIYPGEHEAIIDQDAYDKAQELLNDRARIAASKAPPFRPKYLLSGLLVCGNCGALYFARKNRIGHGEKARRVPYYFCYSRAHAKRRVIDPNCKNPTYRAEVLEKRILQEIERLVDDEKYFKKVAGSSQEFDIKQIESDRAALVKRIDDLTLQISRIVDLYQVGTISIQEIGERTRKLQDEKIALQNTLENMVIPEDNRMSVKEVKAILPKCALVLESDDMESKRAMLKKIIQKIVLKPTVGEIDIHWNF